MTVNVFGQTIDVPRVDGNGKYFDEKLGEIVEKREERRIMKGFLDGRSLAGKIRLEEIVDKVRTKIKGPEGELDSQQRDLAVRFYIERLKTQPLGQADSLYHDLALRLVKSGKRAGFRKQLDKFQRGKIDVTDLPDTFPGEFKKAETLLVGKIRSEIGRSEYQSYLHHKELLTQLRVLAQDLFYGINSGLLPEEVGRYMAVRFELRKLQESTPTNSSRLRKNIVNAIRDNTVLELIHIKCLRFTYPHGERLRIIEDLSDIAVPTKNGCVHNPLSEKRTVNRLKSVFNVFTEFGVPVRMIVLLSDQDLIDYFPGGECSFLPAEDIDKAGSSVEKYKTVVEKAVDFGQVDYFRDYLQQQNQLEEFDQVREKTIRELRRGISVYPESLVEERVDYRCQSNEEIFTNSPDRQFARERVYAQLGSLQALKFLDLDENGENKPMVLIEEDYGDQNKYIGGKRRTALPVYFTKLRDKVEVL